MQIRVIEAPEPFLSDEEVALHLRLETYDSGFSLYRDAACSWIDGPAGGGWLGRSFGKQTLEVALDDFNLDEPLPFGPVLAILSVKHVAADGAEAVVQPASYYLADDRIYLTPGAAWPISRGDAGGVRIRYQTGGEKVPPSVKQAALLMVGQWFRNRMAVNTGNLSVTEMPFGVEALLAPFRRWRI